MSEELEFELTDILEDVNPQNVKKVIADNVVYLLKREHKRGYVNFPKGFTVIIPEGAYDYSIVGNLDLGLHSRRFLDKRNKSEDEHEFFEGDFEIFSSPNTIDRYGHVLGTISAGSLLEITVWLKNDKPLEVTLKWIRNSRSDLAKKLREAISLTPPNECVLCAMFFADKYNGERTRFSEIAPDETDHFQQILDSSDERVRAILEDTPLVKIVRLE